MAWKKPSPELLTLLEAFVAPYHYTLQKMFGSPTYFVNNNMWTAVHQDSIMLRLSDEDRDNAFTTCGESIAFEPMGRCMWEYVLAPEQVYNEPDEFAAWLERSHAYVASLPPKERKRRRKRSET